MSLPILFIAYKRERPLLENVKSSLREAKKVYVFLDKHEILQEQIILISQLQALANENSNLAFKISDKNLGVANSIPTAIDWFFSQEDFGIICEDDVTISPEFSEFSTYYRSALDTQQIMLISALRFPNSGPELTLVRYPIIWGWSTTRTNWNVLKTYISNPAYTYQKHKGLMVNSFLYSSYLQHIQKPWNSWVLPIAVTMRCKGQFCLIPPVNLSINSGVDAFATHKPINITKTINSIEPLGQLQKMVEIPGHENMKVEKWIEKNVYQISFRNVIGVLKNITKIFLKY